MYTDDKPDLFWVQDSSGLSTCHINAPDLTFNDSLIGSIVSKNTDCCIEWFVVLKHGVDIGTYPTVDRARKALEAFYRKTILSIKTKHGE